MFSKKIPSYLSAVVCATVLFAAFLAPAYALWPFGGDDATDSTMTTNDKQAVLPPDDTYKDRECEPLRQKAVRLNQTMASWNPWREIQVSRLKRKHRKCVRAFGEQEYVYLQRVNIGKEASATDSASD